MGTRDWWKLLNSMINNKKCSSMPSLVSPSTNIPVTSDFEKAELLNVYFCDQTSICEDNKTVPTDQVNNVQTRLDSVSLSAQEVNDILRNLKPFKASGPDGISNRFLKEVATEISEPLCDLFNASLSSSKFPSPWKLANVCAVYKKGDKSLVNNYRPISLLNTIEKVFERLVCKHIYNFLHSSNYFTAFQSGFIPGDSAVNQLTCLYDAFCKALDDGLDVRIVFFDISKAFDKVWHKGLLYKLKMAGISGTLLRWFEDYLKDRKQHVVLPGATSGWLTLGAGVPQGSILGPLLFLVYINDIVADVDSNMRLFADDTSMFVIVDNPVNSANRLQLDIDRISGWADKWLVNFNPSKSEHLLISRRVAPVLHPSLYMHDTLIPTVSCHKHLGVHFSDKCTWHNHIDCIKSRAWQRVHIMRKLKFALDRKSLETIYTFFVLPILEYADIVWDNCTLSDKAELDKIHYEAGRIVTGATNLVSIDKLLTDLGWETLQERRNKHKLIQIYKMTHRLTPDYLASLIPPQVGDTMQYNLRNAHNVNLVSARTTLYYNSFLPSTLREWNSLPQYARDIPTLSQFKAFLSRNKPKPKSYFYFGNRNSQVIHARLRMKCSSLNYHLYSKNIVESPRCICGKIENNFHYFFECHRYNQQRQVLINKVSTKAVCSLDLLLYGDESLTYDANVSILEAVFDYIRATKRFS